MVHFPTRSRQIEIYKDLKTWPSTLSSYNIEEIWRTDFVTYKHEKTFLMKWLKISKLKNTQNV